MKCTILFWAMLIAFKFSYAQNSNPWPTSGNVGIGTTSPAAPLDVRGAIAFGVNSGGLLSGEPNGAIELGPNTSSSATPYLDFHYGTNSSQDYNMRLINDGNNRLSLINSSATYVLSAVGNKVGIFDINPISTFQVDGGSSKICLGDASGETLNWGTSYLGFNAGRSGSNWTLHTDGTSNGGGVVYSSVTGDIYFAPLVSIGNTDRTLTDAQIASSINFKITPTAAYAKKLYVTVAPGVWPDYVFKSNYRLKPLSELRSYIEANHHLPEIPAATKVEKDGQDLGEMNKLLLKKVEELTLYLIKKDTEDEKKSAKIVVLEKEMKVLKHKLLKP